MIPHIVIVGAGRAAVNHLGAIAALNTPASPAQVLIYDIETEKAELLARQYGHSACTDTQQLFERNSPCLFIVCTPPDSHLDWAAEAVQQNNRVLVEKPFATNAANAETFLQHFKDRSRLIGAAAQHRFSDDFILFSKKMEMLDPGAIRQVKLVIRRHRKQKHFDGDFSWKGEKKQSGGGVLITVGFHYLDLLVSCIGSPKNIAIKNWVLSGDVESGVLAELDYGNFNCIVDAFWGETANEPDTIEIWHKQGLIRFKGGLLNSVNGLAADKSVLFQNQLKAVFSAIQNNIPMPVPANAVLPALRIINDIYACND